MRIPDLSYFNCLYVKKITPINKNLITGIAIACLSIGSLIVGITKNLFALKIAGKCGLLLLSSLILYKIYKIVQSILIFSYALHRSFTELSHPVLPKKKTEKKIEFSADEKNHGKIDFEEFKMGKNSRVRNALFLKSFHNCMNNGKFETIISQIEYLKEQEQNIITIARLIPAFEIAFDNLSLRVIHKNNTSFNKLINNLDQLFEKKLNLKIGNLDKKWCKIKEKALNQCSDKRK